MEHTIFKTRKIIWKCGSKCQHLKGAKGLTSKVQLFGCEKSMLPHIYIGNLTGRIKILDWKVIKDWSN